VQSEAFGNDGVCTDTEAKCVMYTPAAGVSTSDTFGSILAHNPSRISGEYVGK
jgi:hypothetical protein